MSVLRLRVIFRASALGCALATAGLGTAQEASPNRFLSPFKSAGKRIADSSKSIANRVTGKHPHRSQTGTVPGFAQGDITADIQPASFANVQFAMGKSYEDNHEDEQAIMAYQAAIRNYPQHWQALHRLALVKERMGQGNESGQLFSKAVAIKPDDLDLLVDFGYWAYLRRDWPLAEKLLKDALAIKPSDSRARNNYALLLARSGHTEQAIGQFLAAGLDLQAAHANLAFAQMTEGDVASAKATLAKSLQLAPASDTTQQLVSTVERLEITSRGPDSISSQPVTAKPVVARTRLPAHRVTRNSPTPTWDTSAPVAQSDRVPTNQPRVSPANYGRDDSAQIQVPTSASSEPATARGPAAAPKIVWNTATSNATVSPAGESQRILQSNGRAASSRTDWNESDRPHPARTETVRLEWPTELLGRHHSMNKEAHATPHTDQPIARERKAPARVDSRRPISVTPVAPAPVTLAPVIQAPVTEASVTEVPVTQAPVTQASVTQASGTQVSGTQVSGTLAPIIDASMLKKPREQRWDRAGGN